MNGKLMLVMPCRCAFPDFFAAPPVDVPVYMDVDEVDDPAETHDGNDTLWEQDAGIVIRDDESTHQAEALTSQDGWGAIDTTFSGTWSWGDPEPGGEWGKDVLAEKWGSVAPEVGDWDAPDHST